MHYIGLQEAGCPIERHELTDEQWLLLGRLKREMDKIIGKKVSKDGKYTAIDA